MERLTLALLVQNPQLAEKLEKNPLDWQRLEFKGIETFKKIVQQICVEKPISTAQIIESYRGLPEEKMLNALASLPVFIPDEGIEAEFLGALKQLVTQGRKNRLNKLVEQEQAVGLNQQEKEILRDLLQLR
jgi:DNA primase